MEVEMNFWYDYHLQLNLIWNVKSTINNYLFYLLIAAMLQPFHFQKCYVLYELPQWQTIFLFHVITILSIFVESKVLLENFEGLHFLIWITLFLNI